MPGVAPIERNGTWKLVSPFSAMEVDRRIRIGQPLPRQLGGECEEWDVPRPAQTFWVGSEAHDGPMIETIFKWFDVN